MSIFLNHPSDWIGIPYFDKGDRWERPEDWARELIEEIVVGQNLPRRKRVSQEQRDIVENIFVMLAKSVEEREASSSYLRLSDWYGPLILVDLRVESRYSAGTISIEDYAGASDPDAIDPPLVEPFVTTSGLVGVRGTRHVVPDPAVPGIIATVEYAWEVDETLVRLRTATYDLIEFEQTLPYVDALAETVYSQ